jgi:hypothetical protein
MLDNLPMLGINASPDATNRLSVATEATLLNHEGTGHQLKLNKATPGDMASLLFQTGFSSRAEMGTTGSDDFTIKVSPNGSTWHDGLVVSRNSGALNAPNGLNATTLTRAGSPVYAQSTILGTVSQSGGVPTGEVIHRGSNDNGEFVRFADGTQICTRMVNIGTSAGQFDHTAQNVRQRYSYPATFSDTAQVAVAGAMSGSGSASEWARLADMVFMGGGDWSVIQRGSHTQGGQAILLQAIGRWFNP